MEKIKLTKRKYLGEGYFYTFKNKNDGKFFIEYCTKEDYEKLAIANPENPTLEGCDFVSASGGTVKVNTPTGLLGENDYCDMGDRYAVCFMSKNIGLMTSFVDYEKIQNDEINKNQIDIWQ